MGLAIGFNSSRHTRDNLLIYMRLKKTLILDLLQHILLRIPLNFFAYVRYTVAKHLFLKAKAGYAITRSYKVFE